MTRFSRNDSLINSDFLPPIGGFNSTFRLFPPIFFMFYIISNISIQRFMFNISKHYLCNCNCRLNAFMSCIKQCVNTSKSHFRYSFCVDFICLVTDQMSYSSSSLIKCKNLTQKIIDIEKKWLYKVKNAHKM